MKRFLIIGFLLSVFVHLSAQEKTEEKAFGIHFTGFIKNDFILDTRQTVSVREGHFLLYPSNTRLDNDGIDINDRASFNYLSIQSRLTGKITGPDAFGAKTSGVIEGAFFGHTNSDINGFRLRHAFVKLNWPSTELIMGQYWHMMFVPECFPATISFNTGVPFQFFSRNPQIRLSQKIGNIKLSGAVATQRDFASPGGTDPLRNALLPDLQGSIQYSNGKNIYAGIVGGYKQLVPRIVTDSLYVTDAKVKGFLGEAYLKLVTEPLTIKIEGSYLQNGYDGLTIGGFAVHTINDPLRNIVEYTTLNTLTFWSDIHTNGKKFQTGVFVGGAFNLGSSDPLDDVSNISQYTRGSNIAYLYRISPRAQITSGKVRFAGEIEHTIAGYGKTINLDGIPENINNVANTRILVAVYYFF